MSVLNLQVRHFCGLAYMGMRSVRGLSLNKNRVALKEKVKSFLVVIILKVFRKWTL
jgi:hypothetical protein